MAKNTARGTDFDSTAGSNVAGGDVTTVRSETVTVTEETIPAGRLDDLDLDSDMDAPRSEGIASPMMAAGTTLPAADDDMMDSAAAEPLAGVSTPTFMNEVRGGGAPIPPSQIGETDAVPAPMTSGAAEAVEGVKAKTSQVVDSAKQAASGALDTAKQKAGEYAGQAKDKVISEISSQKDKAATGLEALTSALRQGGQCFDGPDVPLPIGDYAQSFAGQVDRVAAYLRERDVDEIAREVEGYARKNPTLFVGGSFLLGLALARFFKSSESSAASFRAEAASNNFGTASRSGGALVPVEGTYRGDLSSRTEEGHTSRFSEDALPDNRPLTAHNYVPGIGVIEQKNTGTTGV